MEGHCSTGQSPQSAVVPMVEEEEENQREVLIPQIYLLKLYTFRTVPLSIIRCLALYTQQYIQVMLTAC